MLIGKEDVECHKLLDELVAKTVSQVSDAVHRGAHVRSRRVNSKTYWSHPPAKRKRNIKKLEKTFSRFFPQIYSKFGKE